jgi:putative Holliday junction resolvase
MSKFLALDVGEKRIGLALSDDIGILAIPFKAIDRDGSVEVVREIAKSEDVAMLIIGLPYLESGELGSQATDVKNYTKELTQEINLPYEFVSELLTSKEAEGRIKEQKGRVENKGEIDTMAATIILEEYLGSKN